MSSANKRDPKDLFLATKTLVLQLLGYQAAPAREPAELLPAFRFSTDYLAKTQDSPRAGLRRPMLAAQPERRRMQRCDLQEPVTIKFWDHGPRETTGTVLNASPDGIYLESDREIPQHSPLELVFLFPATLRSPGVRFLCQCRIVRHLCRPAGNHGLALAIVRTESERLARREVQPDSSWSFPDFALAEP